MFPSEAPANNAASGNESIEAIENGLRVLIQSVHLAGGKAVVLRREAPMIPQRHVVGLERACSIPVIVVMRTLSSLAAPHADCHAGRRPDPARTGGRHLALGRTDRDPHGAGAVADWACRSPPESSTRLWPATEPDDRGDGHEFQLGVGHRQRTPTARGANLKGRRNDLRHTLPTSALSQSSSQRIHRRRTLFLGFSPDAPPQATLRANFSPQIWHKVICQRSRTEKTRDRSPVFLSIVLACQP